MPADSRRPEAFAHGHATLVMWLVLAGLVLGFATDFVIEAAGV